jgi:hypothetical protein
LIHFTKISTEESVDLEALQALSKLILHSRMTFQSKRKKGPKGAISVSIFSLRYHRHRVLNIDGLILNRKSKTARHCPKKNTSNCSGT